jgi:hypothetical protein
LRRRARRRLFYGGATRREDQEENYASAPCVHHWFRPKTREEMEGMKGLLVYADTLGASGGAVCSVAN